MGGVNLEIINEEHSSASIEVPDAESEKELSSVSIHVSLRNQRESDKE